MVRLNYLVIDRFAFGVFLEFLEINWLACEVAGGRGRGTGRISELAELQGNHHFLTVIWLEIRELIVSLNVRLLRTIGTEQQPVPIDCTARTITFQRFFMASVRDTCAHATTWGKCQVVPSRRWCDGVKLSKTSESTNDAGRLVTQCLPFLRHIRCGFVRTSNAYVCPYAWLRTGIGRFFHVRYGYPKVVCLSVYVVPWMRAAIFNACVCVCVHEF